MFLFSFNDPRFSKSLFDCESFLVFVFCPRYFHNLCFSIMNFPFQDELNRFDWESVIVDEVHKIKVYFCHSFFCFINFHAINQFLCTLLFINIDME